jgi:LysM repeat protein
MSKELNHSFFTYTGRSHYNAIVVLLFFFAFPLFALGQHMTTEEYIQKYKDVAIKKMKEFKIPASITLAQGILESGSGNSKLARKANNHFGIKCHKDWHGKKFYMDDDEKHECFRKYKKAEDSYRDHSLFLTQRGRYSFLFNYDPTDYKKWAYGLKKAGYATNPRYPQLLLHLIDKYKLYQYDGKIKGGKKHKHEKFVPGPMPDPAHFEEKGISKSGRMIYKNNKTKLVFAKKGDTYKKLSREFDLYPYQIRKYNDVNKKHILKVGEIVYIKKKRDKAAKTYPAHKVKSGESVWYISQLYGIREKKLRELNNLSEKERVKAGTVLKLR